MKYAASLLLLLAAFFFLPACRTPPPAGRAGPNPPSPSSAPSHAATFTASPNRIIGYILAIDDARDIAVIDLTVDQPLAALRDGAELVVRTRDLRRTARLSATRFLRGRTLSARIVSGLPAVGEEVVMGAP